MVFTDFYNILEKVIFLFDRLAKRTKEIPLSGISSIFEKAQTMKNVVRMELGEPDFETPEHIKEAAKRALDDGHTHYTSSSGILELREAVADRMKKDDGLSVDPGREVVITSGAASAISLTILSVINPGEEVLIPDPSWPHYDPCVRMAGGVPVSYALPPENDFRLDVEDLRRNKSAKTKMMILNSPNNPTGSTVASRDVKSIAEFLVNEDLMLLDDRVYEKIIYEEPPIHMMNINGMRERTIAVNSLSKTYAMTGWRIGYVVAPEKISANVARLNLYANACANSIAQKAGVAALLGPQDCVTEMVEEYRVRRNLITKELNGIDGLSCVTPTGAFYAFPRITELEILSGDFSMALLDEVGVSSIPGSAFGGQGEGFVRLSYTNTIDQISIGVDRIRKFVDRLQRKQ